MDILESLKQLRDDLKTWVTNNLNALNAKIDEKTISIDSKLDSSSTNPVQNKAIVEAINNIPTFSGDYNDLTNAPNIIEDESGSMVISDESGNIIFKADANGIATTALTLNGEAAATEAYVTEAISNIEIPETDLTDYYTKIETNAAIETVKSELSESITSENDEWKIVDETGNIIFSVDADGTHTIALTLNGENVEDIIDNKVSSLVDSAPEKLNTLNELAAALGDDPNFATTIITEIGNKVDKEDGKGLSTNDFTDDYKNTLDNLDGITFEETDPTVPDWAKTENKPEYTAEEVGALADTTTLADLSSDTEHRTVSDSEKSIWNAKSTFSGDYNDLKNAPNIIEDDEENLSIIDTDGNIIFQSGTNGIETTQVITNTLIVNTVNIEESLNDKLNFSDLNDAITTALSEAKESGEFDGADGYTPVKGADYFTEADKTEMVNLVLAALPSAEEGTF